MELNKQMKYKSKYKTSSKSTKRKKRKKKSQKVQSISASERFKYHKKKNLFLLLVVLLSFISFLFLYFYSTSLDCNQIKDSGKRTDGLYRISLSNQFVQKSFEAFCDMSTDENAWIVSLIIIQI